MAGVGSGTFQKYDGTTDPVDHIRGFKQVMRIETSDEKLMCKIFPTSLTGSAAKWFQDLKPQSISSLDELTRVFVSQYFCSREQKKDMAALFCTKQNVGEKIGKFFERFKAEMRGISCEPQYAAIAFREGLLPGTALYRNLIRSPPKDMDDVLTRVEGEIRLERASEAQAIRFTATVTSREPRRNSREMETRRYRGRNSRGERSEDHPLREWFTASPAYIYKQHCQEGIFKKPPPQPDSGSESEKKLFCPLHEAHGHPIQKCRALKPQILELMKEGKLLQYRQLVEGNHERAREKPTTAGTGPRIREILAVHGRPATLKAEGARIRSETRQVEKKRKTCRGEKLENSDSSGYEPIISFSRKDAEGIQFPHEDALVISTMVQDCLVRRVMVDPGSSADIIFLKAFRQLNIEPSKIKRSNTPLTAFEGTEAWPYGEVTLPVTTAGKTIEVDLVIVDKPSTYNIMLGRGWLHKMDAEASTRYQVLKFISTDKKEVISVRGDQMLSKTLYSMAIKKKFPQYEEEQA